MTAAELRAAVKSRLDIDSSVTTFDDFIDDAGEAAVDSLYPIEQEEIDAQTETITVDSYGEAKVTIGSVTTPIDDVVTLEVSSGGAFSDHDDFTLHGSELFIRDLSSDYTQVRIFGTARYDAIDDVPKQILKAVIWYTMSEFYDFLAGNKRYYNIYTSSGAREVDNMQDMSEYYGAKADAYLNDRATLRGRA